MSKDFLSSFPLFKNHRLNNASNPSKDKGEVKTSIWYTNDIHGQISQLNGQKCGSDEFTKSHKNDDVDSFKLCAGDTLIGQDQKQNNLWIEALDLLGIEVSVFGNHEFDQGIKNLTDSIKKSKVTKFLSTNLNIPENNPLKESLKDGNFFKSLIKSKNGHDYGFIGASPIDMSDRIDHKTDLGGVSIKNEEQTINELQQEVDNLTKNKGINKIIALLHVNEDECKHIAEKTSGIDVIVSGHPHVIYPGVEEGKNFVKDKDGNPVLILQAGKDGKHYGIADVVFDSKGVIKVAKNRVITATNKVKDFIVDVLEHKFLGESRMIGFNVSSCNTLGAHTSENPLCNLVADAVRDKAKAQVAIMNAGNVRGTLDAGVITTRSIDRLMPFKNKIYKVELSEKDLIETLKAGVKSLGSDHPKPGLIHTSGLKYTVSSSKELRNVMIQNEKGEWSKLNHENPDESKKFSVIYDEFLMGGGDNLPMLKKQDKILESYEWSKQDAIKDYIQKMSFKPIFMKPDGRITIENKN